MKHQLLQHADIPPLLSTERHTRHDVHPLWKEADPAAFLAQHGGGGPETRKLVSASVMRALGAKGFLINVSRGSVEDENALIQALEQGVIAGAGLDVYVDEPRVPVRLLALEQLVLLPHLARTTHETRHGMADLVLENLDAYYAAG